MGTFTKLDKRLNTICLEIKEIRNELDKLREVVKQEYEKKSDKGFNLSEKIQGLPSGFSRDVVETKHAKEKIQNAQKRLKDICRGLPTIRWHIDKIFKEEFGKELI